MVRIFDKLVLEQGIDLGSSSGQLRVSRLFNIDIFFVGRLAQDVEETWHETKNTRPECILRVRELAQFFERKIFQMSPLFEPIITLKK